MAFPAPARETRDSTFGPRVLVSVPLLAGAMVFAWRAWSGVSDLNTHGRSSLTALAIVGGLPVAMSVACAVFGVAIARGWRITADALEDGRPNAEAPALVSALRIIGPLVIGVLPMFQNPPAGISWAQFLRESSLPLLGGSLVGAGFAFLIVAAFDRLRRRGRKTSLRDRG